jgi:hypothetical protein
MKITNSKQDIWHPHIWPQDGNENSQLEAKNIMCAFDGNKNDQFEARNMDFSTGMGKSAPKCSATTCGPPRSLQAAQLLKRKQLGI